MRTHLICARIEADRILPRMTRYLRDNLGWTTSEYPDRNADLNLFIPYIQWSQNFRGWHKTPIGAWFTHRDTENEVKEAWWEEAAAAMDLRMAHPGRYVAELEAHGLTRIGYPPVERDRFTVNEKEWGPVIGVSGFTYGDNRKGEDLLARLYKSDLRDTAEWKASGRGWPIPTQGYPWEAMPSFFQSLDILLCTSRIEGGPLPVVEAMSTGARVVIPRGVGFCDYIPDTPDVFRFEAGDYESLYQAVKEALEAGPGIDREGQREAVKDFSEAGWVNQWLRAAEDLLYDVPHHKPGDGERGIYTVAFGTPARRCAKACVSSIREHMPGLPVALAGAAPLKVEDHFLKMPDTDIGGRRGKLAVYKAAPKEWEYVLYLDADTELQGPVNFLFELLEAGWEAVICKDMAKFAEVRAMIRPDNQAEYEETIALLGSEDLLQYNGGVFAFRRTPRIERLFTLWNQEWEKYGARDQGALLRALYRQPVRLFVLPNLWNATDRYNLPPGELAILHHNMHARRWSGLIRGRTDSEEAWNQVERWQNKHGDLSPGEVGR